jgi:hypothetical protein
VVNERRVGRMKHFILRTLVVLASCASLQFVAGFTSLQVFVLIAVISALVMLGQMCD